MNGYVAEPVKATAVLYVQYLVSGLAWLP